jgi:hypothetical protein
MIIGSTLGLVNKFYSTSNINKPYRLNKLDQINMNLSKELKEILVGLCLGDLCIDKQKPT